MISKTVLKIFDKNMIVQVLLVVVVLGLLWLRPMLTGATMQQSPGDGILYDMLYTWFGTSSGWSIALSMALILAEGVALNLIMASAGIVPQTSLMPTMLYVATASAGAQPLSPMLLVNAALIVFVSQLMLHGMLLTVSTTKICSATAMLGLCTMIYTPSVAFLLSYLLVAVSYRLYNWRDWMALLLGLAAPLLLLLAVLYLTDSFAAWWDGIYLPPPAFRHRAGDTTAGLVANIVVTLIMLAALLMLWSRLGEKPVIWQKNASTVMYLTVGGIAMLLLTAVVPVDPSLFAIPFALCGHHLLMPTGSARYAVRKRRPWIYDLLFLLLIIACLTC